MEKDWQKMFLFGSWINNLTIYVYEGNNFYKKKNILQFLYLLIVCWKNVPIINTLVLHILYIGIFNIISKILFKLYNEDCIKIVFKQFCWVLFLVSQIDNIILLLKMKRNGESELNCIIFHILRIFHIKTVVIFPPFFR